MFADFFSFQFNLFLESSSLFEQARENLKIGVYGSRNHTNGRAKFWNRINEIFDVETQTQVECLYHCTECNDIIYNGAKDGNTMAFLRHICLSEKSKKIGKRLLISNEEKQKLTAASALFVTKDFRPFHAVECGGFLGLCTAVMQFGQKYPKATADDLKMAMPTRNTVCSHVAKISSEVKDKIREIMEAAKGQKSLAATLDCWTDNYRHISYMCITIHATLIENRQIKNYRYVISMDAITALVKTKKVIADAVLKVFASYGYSEDDVRIFVTFICDRGANIKYGLLERGFTVIHCYSHLLNNLTGKMLTLPEVKTILKNASKLCSYMKKTGLNSRLNVSLKTYSKTRWNGACIMLSSLLEADFNLLTEILVEKQRATKTELVSMVTVLNKDELRPICEFLTSFKKWSDVLEGEINETLHFVWPAYLSIQKLLEEDYANYHESETTLVELMKAEGRAYIQKNSSDFKPKISHKIAVVLHPLMRKLPNIDTYEREAVYAQTEEMLIEYGDREETPKEQQVDSVRMTKTSNTVLSAFFEENVIEPNCGGDLDRPSELRDYLNMTIKISDPENFDLKKWWFEKKTQFPNLSKMFVRHSCITATSAPSERNFSESGLIVTNRRTHLLPTNVSNLIIARNVNKNI